ncbi:hypothetical protein R3P38DRAFT_3620537 [Favolaschia claudopus]|uniref:Phytochrome n=1 Tax=Favolaschia claudopus TaxID=2862362 RepID=A0AAW0DG24_9AGAR
MPNTDSNLSSSSYVYPIRSLFSGTIQPARNDNAGGASVDLSRRDSTTATTFPAGNASTSKFQSKSAASRSGRRTVSESSAQSPKVDSTPTKKSKKRRHRSSNVPPNFRNFPGEDAAPNLRRTFTASSISSLTQVSIRNRRRIPYPRTKTSAGTTELRARPKQVPVSDDPLPPEEVPDAETPDPPLRWNESQLDLVRLPPLPSDSVFPLFDQLETADDHILLNGLLLVPLLLVQGRSQAHSPDRSQVQSLSLLLPIRTPGAVQGFDVLIAVDELGDALVVRQVSENAEELLGLPPRYLFSLECFTDTLPESQAQCAGLDVIAGMLYVPVSSEGKDFICFLRKGQPRHVHWAGNPHTKTQTETLLEPRMSFATWSETVLETAGVLAWVYGKFIEVWRQKENALQTTRLTNLLLSNASHEVRTPLNHIINYLEMALNGPLDDETRDNLSRSHAASKSLLFTINDLLDLTRLESGNETTFNEPFDLQYAIDDATHLYRKEAQRRNIAFHLELDQSPKVVVGDSKKIRTVVQNLTANSLKNPSEGTITVACATYDEPELLRGPKQTAVEIVVEHTGCGIGPDRLASIFREFEQVEPLEPRPGAGGGLGSGGGVGLGLAVVARIVEQLGGQLRVESKDGEELALSSSSSKDSSFKSLKVRSRRQSLTSSGAGEIDSLVDAIASNHIAGLSPQGSVRGREPSNDPLQITQAVMPVVFGISDSSTPNRPVKVDDFGLDTPAISPGREDLKEFPGMALDSSGELRPQIPAPDYLLRQRSEDSSKLRVLIVDSRGNDNDINRTVLAKRLRLDGDNVVTTTNGSEGLDKVISDRGYDAILMDIQMPISNGYEATERIRDLEKATSSAEIARRSHRHNGGICHSPKYWTSQQVPVSVFLLLLSPMIYPATPVTPLDRIKAARSSVPLQEAILSMLNQSCRVGMGCRGADSKVQFLTVLIGVDHEYVCRLMSQGACLVLAVRAWEDTLLSLKNNDHLG